jgi:GntR family transcriptional regulator/MocR family aminotransferase
MICNSAMQAVELIGRVLLERGHPVWVEDPGHLNVRTALGDFGRAPRPRAGGRPRARRCGRTRAGPRPALIVATPACAHPMGATMSVARRVELIRAAEAGGAWILENDYQGEFAHSAKPPAPVARLDGGERTLCVGTFSHCLFPSLRLAWCVLPRALVPVFEAVRRQLDDHTHGPLQGVLADFIDGGHLAAHLRRMRASYTARRGALVEACAHLLPASVRLGPLEAGMTAALRLPPRWRDAALAARCAAADLPTLPLSRYASAARVNGLLLGYAALDEDDIRAGIARLANLLRAGRA